MPASAPARFTSMLSLLVVLGLVVAACTPGNSGSPNASASGAPSGSGSTATGGTATSAADFSESTSIQLSPGCVRQAGRSTRSSGRALATAASAALRLICAA